MKPWIVLVLVLLAGGLLWSLLASDGERSPVATIGPSVQHVVPTLRPESQAAPVPATPNGDAAITAARSALPALTPLPVTSPTQAPGFEGEPVTIRGRFLYPNLRPAPNVAWEVEVKRNAGSAAASASEVLRGASTREGTFEVRIPIQRARRFTLHARLADFVRVNRRWRSLSPGSVEDLGDVRLERTGTLEGRVVDRRGAPVTAGWTVSMEDKSRESRTTELDSEGRFRFEDVAPGRGVRLWVDTRSRSLHRRAEVVSAETTTVELVYEGPDPRTSVLVEVQAPPYAQRPIYDGNFGSALVLETSSGERYPERLNNRNRFLFENVPSGACRLRIEHADYQPFSQANVHAGDEVTALLQGSCALVLDVRDAVTQKSLEPVSLHGRLRTLRGDDWSKDYELHPGGEALAGGRFEGLVSGDWELIVAHGKRRTTLPLSALQAGEARTVTVELGPGTAIEGRVLLADGRPAVDQLVQLLAPARTADSATSPVTRNKNPHSESRRELEAVSTDKQGRFRVDLARPGRYAVGASRGIGLRTATPVFFVAEGKLVSDVELVLHVGGWIHGTVVRAPEDADVWMRVAVVIPGTRREDRASEAKGPIHRLNSGGTFLHGPVPAGLVEVYVLPDAQGIQYDDEGRPVLGLKLGSVTVRDGGEHDVTFHMEPLAHLVVNVRMNGEPLRRAQVLVGSKGLPQAQVSTNFEGTTRPIVLPPGETSLNVTNFLWACPYIHPDPLELLAGERRELAISFETASGRLRLVDTADRALHEGLVMILPEYGERDEFQASRFPGQSVLATNENGILELQLPAGRYRIRRLADRSEGFAARARPDDPRFVPFTWTRSGPDEERLELP